MLFNHILNELIQDIHQCILLDPQYSTSHYQYDKVKNHPGHIEYSRDQDRLRENPFPGIRR